MKNAVLFLFSFFMLGLGSAQAQVDFFVKDSIQQSGFDLLKGNGRFYNARYIAIKEGNSYVRHFPYEINQYGFSDGRFYQSFEITKYGRTDAYFFERLVKDDVSLYAIPFVKEGTVFFLADQEGMLTQIPSEKEALRNFLEEYVADGTPCRKKASQVAYRKNSMTRFFTDYKNGADRYLPRVKYGILAGVRGTQLQTYQEPSDHPLVQEEKPTWSTMVGGFVDIPIGVSDFSLHTELNLRNVRRSILFEQLQSAYNLVLNHWGLDAPISVRWTAPFPRWRPYIQLGPQFSLPLASSSDWFFFQEVPYDPPFDDEVYQSRRDGTVLARPKFGLLGGIGLAASITSGLELFAEARYGWLWNFNLSDPFVYQREPQFIIGIAF
jgi:hypothetical protein